MIITRSSIDTILIGVTLHAEAVASIAEVIPRISSLDWAVIVVIALDAGPRRSFADSPGAAI